MSKKISKEVMDLYKNGGLDEESISCMLASEDVLKKEWDNENDERWDDL